MGTVLVLDDLTEVKALEEQVRRAERLSALGTLAGGVAHEVRNPVGIIRASAQLMGSLPNVMGDSGSQEYLQVITQKPTVSTVWSRSARLRSRRRVEPGAGGHGRVGPQHRPRLASLTEQADVELVVEVSLGCPGLKAMPASWSKCC